MTEQREPLTTADQDVRDMDGFLLNVERLTASELAVLASGDEFKAAVLLWCRAWKQVPAGSLPDDDRILAAFSGAGAKWKKVKEVALRGFIKCSDGRLYHPVVCDAVKYAWSKKQDQRSRTAAATEARSRNRNGKRHDQRDDHRNEERNDHRDVVRNDLQEKGREGKRRESKEESSEAKASGGTPPITPLETPKDRLWREALPYLQRHGTQEKQARGIIGKWLKGRTPEVVLKALAKAQTEQAIDPVPYIERLLTGHSAPSNSYQTGML